MTQSQAASTAVTDADLRPWQRVGREIDLPFATAVWVLVAHVLTILAPLLIVVAVADHRRYLDGVLDRPGLLYVSAGLLVVASVCESAQNTLDRWYLTGAPPSLLDLLFNSLIVLGLAFQLLAVVGDTTWVWPFALGLAALFPLGYLMGWPTPPIQAVLGFAAAITIYRALEQPVIFFSLVTVFFTLFFFDILLRTRQQVMHGFTTLVNAFSVVALVAAIDWAASGKSGWSWPVTIVSAVVLIGLTLAVRPRLLKLPPTPRRYEDASI